MSVTSPIALIRAAVFAQLADPTLGLNAALATSCAAYAVPVVAFDFVPNGRAGRNVYQSFIEYGDTEASGIARLNLLCIYGGVAKAFPAGGQKKLFNATWSGDVTIQIMQYLGVPGDTVQDFEPWGDAGEAAMIGCVNNLNAQQNFAGGGKLYGLEISATRGKVVLDGENWVVPARFDLKFEVYIT